MNDDLATREETIAAFRATRLRAMLALVPLLAATVAGVYLFDAHSDFEFQGMGPEKLVFIVFGAGALSLLAFFFLWRCPSCGASLGFQKGFTLAFCRRCGAVFTEAAPGTSTSPAAQVRGQVDAAVKKDLQRYRARLGVRLMRGVLLLVIGVLIAIFARPGGGPPRPEATLLNRLGPDGATAAIVAIGCAIALVGLLLIAWASRGLTSGVVERELRTREFLGRK